MIREFNLWDMTEDVMFLTEATQSKTFQDALGVNLGPAEEDEDWYEQVQSYLWELRRLFWIELIPQGRIRVKFVHSGARGAGICPATLVRGQSQSTLPSDKSQWPEEDSLVLQADWFYRSDQIYMEGMEDGNLFGWPEIEVLNIETIEHDHELFEHSFSSQDVIEISDSAQVPGWGSLAEEGQTRIAETLSQLVSSQKEAFDQVAIDPVDILAMIAAHPDTSTTVMDLPIFNDEIAIKSLRD